MLVRILVAGIAGAAAMFFGGWIIFGLLLMGYFQSTMTELARSVMNTEPNFAMLIPSHLILGCLYAFIFDYWASIRNFAAGAKGGAILLAVTSLATDLQMAAFFKEMHTGSPFLMFLVNFVASGVLGALVGGVIGAVLGMMRRE